MRLHVLITALAWMVSAAGAQAIQKCVAADGSVSFSDTACPSTARSVALPGSAPSVSWYELKGSTAEALRAGLRTNGRHVARATWSLSYQISWMAGGGGCTVTAVSTTLTLGLHMPRWTPPPGASPDLVARWQRFMQALQVHEDGHLAHGRAAERAVRSALTGMSAGSCAALGPQAQARFQQIIGEYNARDIAYDRETDHGRTQGAVFP